MTFLSTGGDSGGELVRIDSYNPPGPFEPVHVHPEQVSTANVLSGSLLFAIDGREVRVGPGSRVEIPPGTPHTFRNEGPEDARWIQEFRPALRIADFFETLFELARRGDVNAHGLPTVLQLSLSVPAFGREIRLASPPWPVQRLVLAPLAPFARLRGLQPAYSWGLVTEPADRPGAAPA
jgi:quercetin dioxygenase-like cupin family protein